MTTILDTIQSYFTIRTNSDSLGNNGSFTDQHSSSESINEESQLINFKINQSGGANSNSSPIQVNNQIGTLRDILNKNGLLIKRQDLLPNTDDTDIKAQYDAILSDNYLFNITATDVVLVSKAGNYSFVNENGTFPIDRDVINYLMIGIPKIKNQPKPDTPPYNPNKVIRVNLAYSTITDSNTQELKDTQGRIIKVMTGIVLLQTTNKIIATRLLDLKNIEDAKNPGLFNTIFTGIDLTRKSNPKPILDRCQQIGIIRNLIKLTQVWSTLQILPPLPSDISQNNNRLKERSRIVNVIRILQN